jgi:hypothetical protein
MVHSGGGIQAINTLNLELLHRCRYYFLEGYLSKLQTHLLLHSQVTIGASQQFGCVLMADFLSGLGKKLKQNPTAFENYRRMYIPPGVPQPGEATEPLRTNVLFQHIQVRRSFSSFFLLLLVQLTGFIVGRI